MTGLEIGRLAEKARDGDVRALREFIALAQLEGYVHAGRRGVLYLDGRRTGIRGWQALADRVYFGLARFRIETGRGE